MRRWRLLLWFAAILVVIAAVLGGWLVHTESGLRFVLARTKAALPGLAVGSISGTLGGTVRADRLHYQGASARIDVERIEAHLQLMPLMFGNLSLDALALQAPHVLLPIPKGAAGPPAKQAKLDLPWLRINRLSAGDIQVQREGSAAMQWQSFSGSLQMQGTHIDLGDFRLQQINYLMRGDVGIDMDDTWLLRQSDFVLATPAGAARPIQARLRRSGNGHAAPLELQLAQPLQAALRIRPGRQLDDFDALLTLPRQDATAFGLPATLPIGARLAFHRAAARITLGGDIELGPHRAAITDAALQWLDSGLQIDALPLHIADLGSVQLRGLVPFSGDGAVALTLSTEQLKFQPAQQAPIDVSGTLAATGIYSDIEIVPALHLVQPGMPPGALTGKLRINAEAIQFEALSLALPRGSITVDGALSRAEAARAELDLHLADFDPGLLLADWPGQLSGAASWVGTWNPAGAEGTLAIERIDGTLRALPFVLKGQLRAEQGALRDADLSAELGNARLQLQGDLQGPNALSAVLDVPDLSALDARGGGSLHVIADRDRAWQLDVRANQLKWEDFSVHGVQLSGTIGNATDPEVNLQGHVDALSQGRWFIDSIDLGVVGTEDTHVLNAKLLSGQGNLELSANGSWAQSTWSGVIDRFDFDLPDAHHLRLQQPIALAAGAGELDLSPSCWSGGEEAHFCLQGNYRNGKGALALDVGALPLGWFGTLANAHGYALQDAVLQGSGSAEFDDGRLLLARLALSSEQGRLLVPERADLLLGYRMLKLDATFDGDHGSATASTELLPEGHAQAEFEIQRNAAGAIGYDGNVSVLIRQLDAIEAFTTEIANPTGQINGQVRLQQDGSGLRVGGSVVLSQFKAEVPSLGLSLKNGSIALAGVPEGMILRGAVQSGDGVLTVDGRWTGASVRTLVLKISGSDVRLSNTPELSLTATPALDLQRDDHGWNLGGTLDIPRARILADQLSSGTTNSADVVVIDDAIAAEPAEKWRARVNVRMGDDVVLKGFGFDGKLRGQIEVRQSNGRSATATGQLAVTGLYNAYGQKLSVETGELLYAGSPLDEPSVRVRAERKIGDSTAGIEITGTAQRLQSRVYARPALSESDALALLVTGRRLRDVRGGDANKLSGAALALGTIGGDMLAKNLGLDELGVSSNAGLQGEAFTIGKYLSPRLFVGYGIGLLTRGEVFTVRYLINDHVDVEANIGERQRATVNYRIER